jgi:hypothetical protein
MMQNDGKSLFAANGMLHIKNVLSKELCNYLSHVMMRYGAIQRQRKGDEQVPGCLSYMDHDIVFETVHEMLWPEIEAVLGMELLPTYAYARLYQNGNTLEKHSDRDECEISVTLQLGRSHHYAWPIYMGGHRVDLAEGDAVIYAGNKLEHWRNVCDGPNGYYSGQVFLHFVAANGEHKKLFGDPNIRKIQANHYVKNRTFLMEQK